jgi:hypothetical protein
LIVFAKNQQNHATEKRPSICGTVFNSLLYNDYAFFSAGAVAFLAERAGRDLPKLPMLILPFFVRLSPLPMISTILCFLIKCANIKKNRD